MAVKRFTRFVRANPTITNGSTDPVTFPHPPTVQESGVGADAFGENLTAPAPRGTRFGNLLVTPGQDALGDMGGVVSMYLDALWRVADMWVQKVELVDADGNVLDTIFDDTTGIEADSNELVNLLKLIPITYGQGLMLTIYNDTGGDVTAPMVARFDIGLAAQQPELDAIADLS
jgi:hypothetical protein